MIPEALVLSFIIGLIRGGKVANLAAIPLRKAWLIIAPGILLLALWVAKGQGLAFAGSLARYVHLAAYACVLAALYYNLNLRGMWLVVLGTGLNLLATLANGGKMPISLAAVKAAHMHELAEMLVSNNDFIRHSLMSSHTRLNILADIIPAPRPPFPFPGVMSVGDILISVGLFVVVQCAMLGRPLRKPPAKE